MNLTAVLNTDIAAVELRYPAGSYLRYRTDANGTRALYRLIEREEDDGSTTWLDYESALLPGLVAYTFVDTSTQEETTTTLDLPAEVTGPRIHAITSPSLSIAPHHVTPAYSGGVDLGATVHEPINRSSPIIVSGPARTRKGSFEVWCATHSEARETERVVQGGDGVMMLRSPDHDGFDMYFAALRADVQPAGQAAKGWRWTCRIDYIELEYPTTIVETTNTFQDLLTTGTFLAVALANRDFLEANAGVNV